MLHTLHFSLQNAVYFIILPFLFHVLFTFYVQDVLKFICETPMPKGFSISLIPLFLSVTSVCLPSPFFILSRRFKQATLYLTLTFSIGLTAPLTCYTNQLKKVWKCSCATHFIHKKTERET
jgi:hypothetical protein